MTECVDLKPLLAAARVTVVAGKGGVGKTTVTAVLATAAAAAGMRVLVVELDGKPVLADLVGDVPLLSLSAQIALEEYLRDHGFGRVAKRLASSGVIDVVSTAAPGIDDIVVLGKIKQLERSGDWDAIVVDGPAEPRAHAAPERGRLRHAEVVRLAIVPVGRPEPVAWHADRLGQQVTRFLRRRMADDLGVVEDDPVQVTSPLLSGAVPAG